MSNLYQHRKTSHIGHLLLTILFFPWALVWIAFYISNRNYNERVDERIDRLERERRRS
jgi:hypothetical protein